jgi:hypothetical protein
MIAPNVRRGLAAVVLAAYSLAITCGPAAAATSSSATTSSTTTTTTTSATSSGSKTATGGNWIGVAQTVVVSTSATGKVSGKPSVFTQWSANGSGPATLKVPMSSSGFRNLSGVGKAPITGGYAVWNLHLSGATHERSVAHFPTAKLPLQVSATYELNGKQMKAKDIVGKSGELKVSYTINNVTTKPTTVTFKSALGSKETATVNAPVPIAAIVDVSLPADFTNLKGSSGASASGNGNGTSSASWTLLLFNPLGGVKQSVSYQAHVTDAVVPSATVEAAVLPSKTLPPLPAISEPGAPAIPTVTLGRNLASLQLKLQAARAQLAAKASSALRAFKQFAVPAAKSVSRKAATVAGTLPTASAAAQSASNSALSTATSMTQASSQAAGDSIQAADVDAGLKQASADAADAASRAADAHATLSQRAAEAAGAASQIADILTVLRALPEPVKLTPAYRDLDRKLVDLELLLTVHAARLRTDAVAADLLRLHLIDHAARLRLTAAKAGVLAVALTGVSGLLTRTSAAETNVVAPAAHTASTVITGLVPEASALSTSAAATATTLAGATLSPRKRQPKIIHTKQIGGGAKLDSAVGKLDSAITNAATKVDNAYAYLTALDKRAAENKLPAGNAVGATAQAGAFVYSVSGANNSNHQTTLSTFIGEMALMLGLPLGIAFYRIRRGMPSSLKPPKSAPAPAKG